MKPIHLVKPDASVRLAYIAMIAAVLSTAVSAMFVRWADAPGTVTMFYRTALAGLMLMPLQTCVKNEADEHNQPVRRWLIWALLGGLFFSLDSITWSTAVQSTRVANATFFNTIAPVWVALFTFLFFHDHPPAAFWWGLALTLAGVTLMLGLEFFQSPHLGSGDLLGLSSSIFYAGSFIVTQIARRKASTIAYTRWIALVSGLALAIYNLLLGRALFGYTAFTWASFFGAALVSQVIGNISINYALGYFPATVVSTTMLAKPLIAALLAVPLFGERLGPVDIAGGVMVLAGIYLVNRSR